MNRLLLGAVLVVSCTTLLYSCLTQQEEIVKEGPLKLKKVINAPGKYAYRAFYRGSLGNTIEVFDLETKEPIGTIVPDEQRMIATLAMSPSQPRGLITLFEIPGNVYLFDLHNNSWRKTTIQRNPMGVAVFMPNEDLAWIGVVGNPEVLEVDANSGNVIARVNLSTHFEKPFPHIALSRDGGYLAVLGYSPEPDNYFGDVSVVILNVRTRSVRSVVPLSGVPGHPVFSPDGHLLCIQDFSKGNILLVDIQERKSTVIPLATDSLIKPQFAIFNIAVHPTRDILVASLVGPTGESRGPLNILAVFDLQDKKMKTAIRIGVKVSQLCYQPDGKILYAATPDGIAALDGDTFAVLYEIKSNLLTTSLGEGSNPADNLPGKLVVQEVR